MKKIVITGAESYIGTSFENYMKQWPEKYQVEVVDVVDGTWREMDFSGCDVVFHVAGIAHRKETKENERLYYEVNRDLPIDVAKKAKVEGVGQFIFLSSMSVYGMETGIITKETAPRPKSNYGKSKIQAEEGLFRLQENDFVMTVIRPPMVYGKGCKGNFQTVVKIVKKLPVFPKVKNKRSMIYIDTLCSFVKKCIEEDVGGIFFPQNTEYVNTTEMAKLIAEKLGKKIYCSYLLGAMVNVGKLFFPICKKAFGSLVYQNMESIQDGEAIEFATSIRNSVE